MSWIIYQQFKNMSCCSPLAYGLLCLSRDQHSFFTYYLVVYKYSSPVNGLRHHMTTFLVVIKFQKIEDWNYDESMTTATIFCSAYSLLCYELMRRDHKIQALLSFVPQKLFTFLQKLYKIVFWATYDKHVAIYSNHRMYVDQSQQGLRYSNQEKDDATVTHTNETKIISVCN